MGTYHANANENNNLDDFNAVTMITIETVLMVMIMAVMLTMVMPLIMMMIHAVVLPLNVYRLPGGFIGLLLTQSISNRVSFHMDQL